MKWFKHMTDAAEGNFLMALFDEFGHQGYACYFLLLELCAAKIDTEIEPKFNFHPRIVRQKLRISSTKVQLFLNFCQTKGQLSFNFSENCLKIEIPKLLEYQDKDTKYYRNAIATKSLDKDIDKDIDKDKEKEENNISEKAPSISQPQNLLREKISQENLLSLYAKHDPDFVDSEIDRANKWLVDNPHKNGKAMLNLEKWLLDWFARIQKPKIIRDAIRLQQAKTIKPFRERGERMTIKRKIYDSLVILAQAYDKPVTVERLKIYSEFLSIKLSPEELACSISEIVYRCKFFPSIAEIVEIVKPNQQEMAIDSSSEIIAAVARFGSCNLAEAKSFLGNEKWEIVDKFGGWNMLCKIEESELTFVRAQLRELSKSVQKNNAVTNPQNILKLSPGTESKEICE